MMRSLAPLERGAFVLVLVMKEARKEFIARANQVNFSFAPKQFTQRDRKNLDAIYRTSLLSIFRNSLRTSSSVLVYAKQRIPAPHKHSFMNYVETGLSRVS